MVDPYSANAKPSSWRAVSYILHALIFECVHMVSLERSTGSHFSSKLVAFVRWRRDITNTVYLWAVQRGLFHAVYIRRAQFFVLPRSPTVTLWFLVYWYLSFSMCYIHQLILWEPCLSKRNFYRRRIRRVKVSRGYFESVVSCISGFGTQDISLGLLLPLVNRHFHIIISNTLMIN